MPVKFRQGEVNGTLWRYLNWFKFDDLIRHKAIYFPSLAKIRECDELEGNTGRANNLLASQARAIGSSEFNRPAAKSLGLSTTDDPDINRYIVENNEQISDQSWERSKDNVGCLCLNSADRESNDLWDMYVGKEGGVAIKTNCKRLVRQLNRFPEELLIGRIRYGEHQEHIIGTNIRNLAFFKDSRFASDREVRNLFFANSAHRSWDFEMGVRLAVDLEDFIVELVAAPWATAEDFQRIHELLVGTELTKRLRPSAIHPAS
jgi:hypothetical protein